MAATASFQPVSRVRFPLPAPPLDAVFDRWSVSFGGRGCDSELAEEFGGEQEFRDLASRAHGGCVPAAGDVGTGFDQPA